MTPELERNRELREDELIAALVGHIFRLNLFLKEAKERTQISDLNEENILPSEIAVFDTELEDAYEKEALAHRKAHCLQVRNKAIEILELYDKEIAGLAERNFFPKPRVDGFIVLTESLRKGATSFEEVKKFQTEHPAHIVNPGSVSADDEVPHNRPPLTI